MIADWFKTHRYFEATRQKRTHAPLYEFPIKGGIIRRGLKRPTSKISFKIARPLVEVALRSIIRLEIEG
ncbi:MAG: hypothetical protein MUO97_11520, partial [Dehalococcoidia bacterium]|nr:hypothetical protein [Dehalococcoidia bacterium]